ncbi:putative Myb/SANT-like domain-containing protein [Helianthus annuus]|uniref:Myb/SANT-like domain-containing protein n=1 Tax=Helianthus annuus TaxID=4232 RepID=A0A9K3HX54_HELAN|nr:putative Myb/SANT-like domain-containing protein [Helianthus annuus]
MDLNHENATNKLSTTKASARKTVWDSSTHMIFVELCLEEVKIGNRPASHFNKVGWTNLANNLKTRTGKDYTKLQLKNHWDSMKRDWKLYDHLMRIESGLGWDPVKKTINATSEWWDEKIQVMFDQVVSSQSHRSLGTNFCSLQFKGGSRTYKI